MASLMPHSHDHLARELGRALEVVTGAGRHPVHRDLLGDAAAEQDRDLIVQIIPRVVVLVVDRQLHRDAERHAARDDRHLVNRIGVRQHHREQGVARLVDRRDLLFLVVDDHGAAFRAHQDLVLRELEVEHANDLLVVARGVQRRFVHQVGEVRTGEA